MNGISYKEVSREIRDSLSDLSCLSRDTILKHRIENLPDLPWADMEILDWMPDDQLLPVSFSTYQTPFGEVLIADTPKGVCYLGVENQRGNVYSDFQKRFGYADPVQVETAHQKTACDYLHGRTNEHLVFHLKGTSHQIRIWRKLLNIPYGRVVDYGTLAGSKTHSRAAGTAVGRNPVFFLIPCHRVVRTDGNYDGYFWGKEIKTNLLIWEFAGSKK